MKILLPLPGIFLCLFFFNSVFAEDLKTLSLKGNIGKYAIEMQITDSDYETGLFKGKYKYAGKESYLSLKGEIFQSVIYMEEFYNDKTTGEFFLEWNDGKLAGKWIGNNKSFDVNLSIVQGNEKLLESKSLSEYSQGTSTALTGGYGTENYFLNDMWFSEESPQMEVGFNGGYALIEEINEDSVRFQFELIVGPTYHFATGSGIAIRKGDHYEYRMVVENEKEDCVIQLTFGERSTHLYANQSFICGFGARAYLDHDLVKITDRYEFGDQVSLSDLKK